MRRSRMRSLMLVLFWAALLGAASGLGLRSIRGDQVTCVQCDCKEVNNWWYNANRFSSGSMAAGTNSSVPQAQPTIMAVTGTCQSGTANLQDNTVDIWNFQTHLPACGSVAFQEVNVTDAGGLAAADQPWYKCYVTHD